MPNALTDIDLSVVIASHRRECISECLLAVRTALEKVKRSEIIVVCDYTPGRLAHRFSDVEWRILREKSIPAKRNAGISHARAPVIGFIDDDCRPEPSWARNALTCLWENPDAAGVEGATTIESTRCKSAAIAEYRRLEKQGYRTNNIFYRKKILRMCGMFDERFEFQREDMDLAFTILHLGLVILYRDSVRAKHIVRSGEPWDLLKNCWNRRYDPLLFKKHPEEYRRYVRGPVPPGIGLLSFSCLAGLSTIYGKQGGLLRLPRPFRFPLSAAVHHLLLAAIAARKIKSADSGIVGSVTLPIAYAISPFVLFFALFYGSCKYRKLLLF